MADFIVNSVIDVFMTAASKAGMRASMDLGSSSLLNVPAAGDAAAGEVVKGNDTRLTNPRTPTAHTHLVADLSDASTKGKTLIQAADVEPFTSAEKTKLSGVETGAEVTSAAKVQSAGALMDSEVTSLSGLKTLTVPDSTTISAFAATLLDDANQAAMQATLGLVIGTNVQAYSSVLQNTTASFTSTLETKLNGIETGATADQTPAEILTAVQTQSGRTLATDGAKLDGIESGATADQTNAEIETAYNAQVAQVSAGEKTAGTETAIRRFSPADIKGMIDTHSLDADDLLFCCAASDETTDLAIGQLFKVLFSRNCVVTRIYISLNTAASGANLQIDVEDGGTSILNSVFAFQATSAETSSFTGAASSYAFSKGDTCTIDCDAIGSTTAGAGIKVFFHGYWTS